MQMLMLVNDWCHSKFKDYRIQTLPLLMHVTNTGLNWAEVNSINIAINNSCSYSMYNKKGNIVGYWEDVLTTPRLQWCPCFYWTLQSAVGIWRKCTVCITFYHPQHIFQSSFNFLKSVYTTLGRTLGTSGLNSHNGRLPDPVSLIKVIPFYSWTEDSDYWLLCLDDCLSYCAIPNCTGSLFVKWQGNLGVPREKITQITELSSLEVVFLCSKPWLICQN